MRIDCVLWPTPPTENKQCGRLGSSLSCCKSTQSHGTILLDAHTDPPSATLAQAKDDPSSPGATITTLILASTVSPGLATTKPPTLVSGCAAAVSTTSICSTCVTAACVYEETMTVSCGCPSPAVTIFASHPCELGCDNLGCGTITKVVTEACRFSVLEGGVLMLTCCGFQVLRETGLGKAPSPSLGLVSTTQRWRRRGRADQAGRRRRRRRWKRLLPMGEGAWLLFGFGEGGEVWNVFWGRKCLGQKQKCK